MSADPTILLLLKVILGGTSVAVGCVAIVATIWALDAAFKTTRSYLKITEWRAAWQRERRRNLRIANPGTPEDEAMAIVTRERDEDAED